MSLIARAAALLLLSISLQNPLAAQAPAPFNVQHYKFALTLSDSSDVVRGIADIQLRLARPVKEVSLDLVAPQPGGKGMKVTEVRENESGRRYRQDSEKLIIEASLNESLDRHYTIVYEGIPSDGLIVTKLGDGSKTFFGDNWPNRAHHYLPCIDHPSDKATVEFVVTAPARYQVVSNGIQIEESNLPDGRKRTHYRSDEILPTKVMVVGVGEFAVQLSGESKGIPVSAWVFPDERDPGFREYAKAVTVLDFYSDMIAPYPFGKLANVQSRTRFGGMENAGCIFYHEKSATGDGKSEALIAHEIVHQWFGNTATEMDWHHIWLSEGFATYLTHMYVEAMYGRDAMIKRMRLDRAAIAGFAPTWSMPIVDSTVTDYMSLLNPNSYEKSSWVLHMLRHRVTDSVFSGILRAYYERYKFGNARTEDFRKVAEELSGQDLRSFFQQWLYQPGHPKLELSWAWKKSAGQLSLQVKQTQAKPFAFPLELAFVTEQGQTVLKTVEMNAAVQNFTITLPGAPVDFIVDPGVWLLHEAKIIKGK